MISDNLRIPIRNVADDVAYRSAHAEQFLLMKRAAEKTVPKLLNFKQIQRCMNIAQEMLTRFNDDPDFFKKVITDDESWEPMEVVRRAKIKKARQFQSNYTNTLVCIASSCVCFAVGSF